MVKVILAGRWDKEYRYYDDFFVGIRNTIAALRSLGVDVLIVGRVRHLHSGIVWTCSTD